MRMAYVPIIMEGSVGSGESTGLGFRRPTAHPQLLVVCGVTLSNLPNLSGLRFLHGGDLKGLLPLWEFQGWKAKPGHRGSGQSAGCHFLAVPGLLPMLTQS